MGIKRLDHVNFITHHPETSIAFYCEIIGLTLGEALPIGASQTLYFYVPGCPIAVLHIGDAKETKDRPKFQRLAELGANHHGEFSTGAFDHFCLAVDKDDYEMYINRLKSKGVTYQTYCHPDIGLKQIWILDPNGVRVELNFM